MQDIVYIYRYSCYDSEELRYSLRSVAENCRWIRRVWIFGDRPEWLSGDLELVRHIPHKDFAWLGPYRSPIVNTFAMMHIVALHPEIAPEFIWFCDDYILLKPLTWEMTQKKWAVQDLNQVKSRGRGKFKEALWRTYDLVKKKGMAGINFEAHVPMAFSKRQVLEAVKEFQGEITEDRFAGPLAKTAVLNDTLKRKSTSVEFQFLGEAGIYAGFHGKTFSGQEIEKRCQDKLFLNFDDRAYTKEMRAFLEKEFPTACCYEK